MRFLWSLIKLGILLVLLGVFAKSFGAKWLMSFYLQSQLGTEVKIEDARIDFVNSQVKFTNVIIKNPLVFSEGSMMIIPKIYLDLKPAALLRGRIEFRTVEMKISEIRVLQTPDHGMNLRGVKLLRYELPAVQEGQTEVLAEKFPELYVDRFVLSIGSATYTDLRGENPLQRSYDEVLSYAVFQDIRRLRGMWGIVTSQTLIRMGMGDV